MYPSRFNPDVTYCNKSDRDSDDRHFAKMIAQNDAEILKLKQQIAELRKVLQTPSN
tara:strand:- start:164 stop:331 length:168 start_codon:yes stop_codon:yes gene_type:complete